MIPLSLLTMNWQAFLAIITLILNVFPEIYNMAMIANYGDTVIIAGAGLGVMFVNMFIYGTFEGLNGAIDTLVSQAYGAKDYAGCNVYFNKAKIINTLIFIPIATILAFCDRFLIMINQDPEVSRAAQKFLVYQLPGLYMIVQYDTLRRYLQAQGSFDIPVKGLIVACIFHITALAITLRYIPGDPLVICAIITNFTMAIDYFVLRYLAIESLSKTNQLGLFDGAFDDWWGYLELALPSAFIICAEWWMYEVLALFAGFIGILELATIVIIFNTHNFVYDISYGFSQAASSIIGRTLAESGEFNAKKILYFICIMEGGFCILMTVVYLIFPKEIISIFTSEPTIVDLYIDCIYYIIVMFIIDSIQIVIGGVIRGIGEQSDSSLVSFISYALVSLPFAYFLSFYLSMGLPGLILAYTLGITFCTIFNAYILYKSDWEVVINESLRLSFSSHEA